MYWPIYVAVELSRVGIPISSERYLTGTIDLLVIRTSLKSHFPLQNYTCIVSLDLDLDLGVLDYAATNTRLARLDCREDSYPKIQVYFSTSSDSILRTHMQAGLNSFPMLDLNNS